MKKSKYKLPAKWLRYVNPQRLVDQVPIDLKPPFATTFKRDKNHVYTASAPSIQIDDSFDSIFLRAVTIKAQADALAYVVIAAVRNIYDETEKYVTCHLEYHEKDKIRHKIYALRGNNTWGKHPYAEEIADAHAVEFGTMI